MNFSHHLRCAVVAAVATALATPALGAQQQLSRAVRQGVEVGFRSCAVAMDSMVELAAEDDDAYAHLGFWNSDRPDGSLFNEVLSEDIDGSTAISSISAVKNAQGKCDVTLSKVLAAPDNSCLEIREKVLKDWKFYSELGGATIYEEADNAASNVILSPMKNGCLIVKHVVLFGLDASVNRSTAEAGR